MEFRIAELLGMTVGELRNRMSQDEFIEWAYYLKRKSDLEKEAYDKAKKSSPSKAGRGTKGYIGKRK